MDRPGGRRIVGVQSAVAIGALVCMLVTFSAAMKIPLVRNFVDAGPEDEPVPPGRDATRPAEAGAR